MLYFTLWTEPSPKRALIPAGCAEPKMPKPRTLPQLSSPAEGLLHVLVSGPWGGNTSRSWEGLARIDRAASFEKVGSFQRPVFRQLAALVVEKNPSSVQPTSP